MRKLSLVRTLHYSFWKSPEKTMYYLLILIFLIFPVTASANWNYVASMPTPREGLTAVVLDGKIYAIGGKQQGYSSLNVVEIYDPMTDEWFSAPPILYERAYAASAVYEDKIYLFGGRDGSDLVPEIEVYNPETTEWSYVNTLAPDREGLGAFSLGDSIILVSGHQQITYSREVNVFDPAQNQWLDDLDQIPSPHAGFGAAMVGDSIYVIGGVYYGVLDKVHILFNGDWSEGASLSTPLGNTAACVLGDTIFIAGGFSGVSETDSAFYLSKTDNRWYYLSSMIEKRESHAMVSCNGRIYVMGGGREELSGRVYLSSVETSENVLMSINEGTINNNPQLFYIIENYPNPFSEGTSISITNPVSDFENLPVIIYNVLGEEVMSWSNILNKSTAVLQWNGFNIDGYPLPSGIYFIKVGRNNSSPLKKIIIVR